MKTRMPLLAAMLSCFVVAISAAASEPQAKKGAASDWPTWLGPNGDGLSRETELLKTFPEDGPKILWRQKLGTGYSGLTVAGGKLFTLYGRDGREFVAAFDAASGKPAWAIDIDADFKEGRAFGPRSTPCVDGDRVFALGASGKLHCMEAASGKNVWKLDLLDEFGFSRHEEGVSPSPLVDGKQLIVAAGTAVLALDKANGKLIWRALEEQINHSSPMLRTIDGQKQIVILTGGNLVGLSPKDGKELWRVAQQAVNIATPVVGAKGQIFAGAAYGFGCQSVQVSGKAGKQSAKVVYQNKSLAPHTFTPLLYEGHLYGFDDRPGFFKCVEFATGEEKWQSRDPGKGNAIIADGQMIILTEDGRLVLAPVSTKGFEPTAEATIFRSGISYTAPTLSNGRLYLRTDEELACVRMK